jgi:hypothetical protein
MESSWPVPAGERYPVPWKEVGTSLAVGAGVLALRAGLGLAKHLLERRASSPLELKGWLAGREAEAEPPQPSRKLTVKGWRMWGSWSSDGARHLEVEEIHWQADAE